MVITNNHYSITYDLLKPGQKYDALLTRLRQLGAVQIQLSQWVLSTSMNAVQVRDDLSRYIDANDRIFVAGLTGEAAWKNSLADTNKVKQSLAA